jgi:hypothetical protein
VFHDDPRNIPFAPTTRLVPVAKSRCPGTFEAVVQVPQAGLHYLFATVGLPTNMNEASITENLSFQARSIFIEMADHFSLAAIDFATILFRLGLLKELQSPSQRLKEVCLEFAFLAGVFDDVRVGPLQTAPLWLDEDAVTSAVLKWHDRCMLARTMKCVTSSLHAPSCILGGSGQYKGWVIPIIGRDVASTRLPSFTVTAKDNCGNILCDDQNGVPFQVHFSSAASAGIACGSIKPQVVVIPNKLGQYKVSYRAAAAGDYLAAITIGFVKTSGRVFGSNGKCTISAEQLVGGRMLCITVAAKAPAFPRDVSTTSRVASATVLRPVISGVSPARRPKSHVAPAQACNDPTARPAASSRIGHRPAVPTAAAARLPETDVHASVVAPRRTSRFDGTIHR